MTTSEADYPATQGQIYPQPIVNIEGELVALGPHRRDLLPVYERWINNFSTKRMLGMPPLPVTAEQEAAWYDRAAAGETEPAFTIYERATWRPIGNCDLRRIDYRHGTAEFGIMIGEEDARGKGYGTEATRLMLHFAFSTLGLRNILLRVYEYNPGAIRAYEKAGFKLIGRRRQAVFMGGRLWDMLYMDCIPSDLLQP